MFCPKISCRVVAGVVELVTGFPAGTDLVLDLHYFPEQSQFLELNFTFGETSATICTKKPLDANTLQNVRFLTSTYV